MSGGIMAKECGAELSQFFSARRKAIKWRKVGVKASLFFFVGVCLEVTWFIGHLSETGIQINTKRVNNNAAIATWLKISVR
jgi:hypothetical protein